MTIEDARWAAYVRDVTGGERRREQLRLTRRRASVSLREMRREMHLSKAEVARICCTTRATVDRWEDPDCSSTPDAAQIGAICSECGGQAARWFVRLIGLPWTD